MTIADEARDSALHCEMVKYAYRQTKDGVVVSFVVHPNDVPAALSISHIGARYMVALVQLGDDELPIAQAEKEKQTLPSPKPRPVPQAGARRDWRELQPQQQAGIRCAEPVFVAFLKEVYPKVWREVEDAAAAVRAICDVHSRVELGTNHKARVRWHLLDEQFTAWKAVEHA
jgi:hypothetical protein